MPLPPVSVEEGGGFGHNFKITQGPNDERVQFVWEGNDITSQMQLETIDEDQLKTMLHGKEEITLNELPPAMRQKIEDKGMQAINLVGEAFGGKESIGGKEPAPIQQEKESLVYGLSRMDKPPFTAKPGQYKKGDIIGDQFIYVQNKRWGVEAGFEATLTIDRQDLEERLKTDEKLQGFRNEYVARDPDAPSPEDPEAFHAYCEEHKEDLIELLRNNKEVIKEFQKELKYKKTHFVKLDYSEPDEEGKVAIPLERAIKFSKTLEKSGFGGIAKIIKKIFPFIDKIAQKTHQESTKGTIREKNFGAITESLANDLFTAMGLGGQELCLVPSLYENGLKKLMLDGGEVTGPNGEKFSTLEGKIKSGRLKGNGVVGEDGTHYEFEEGDLAKALVLSLLFADRDKVGSSGGNIGYVVVGGKARLMNIDPGKSLEGKPHLSSTAWKGKKGLQRALVGLKTWFKGTTDRMEHKNLNTDFSFEQPDDTLKDKIQKGYKNYTIFQDVKLSEKMDTMKSLINNWNKVETIFNDYIEKFSQEGDLNFAKDLEEIRTRLKDRKNYFCEVLNERLRLSSDQVNFLDNVEKLTSSTMNEVGKGENSVKLKHLAVIPGHRKEWHLVSDKEKNGAYTLTFNAKTTQERVIVQHRLKRYMPEDLFKNVSTKKNNITISIDNEDMMKQFMQAFDEQKIIEHKHSQKPQRRKSV